MVDLQEEVIRSNRYSTPLSISLLDLDHFKKINDTMGHTTGDEALRSVSARLREQIRHPDTIGRYGGEEFLIVLPSSEIQAAGEQAERLCQTLRTLQVEANDHSFKVTTEMLRKLGHDENQVIPWLQSHGGCCDCEVIFNVETLFGELIESLNDQD